MAAIFHLHLEAAPLGRLPIFPTTPARREHIRAKQKETMPPPVWGDQAGLRRTRVIRPGG
jgi:hypothetical protein